MSLGSPMMMLRSVQTKMAPKQLKDELLRVKDELAASQSREATLEELLEAAEKHRRAAVEQHRLAEVQIRAMMGEPDASRGPSIFLVTLPKSGSIYLLNTLEKGLGYKSYNVSLGYFPRDLVDWPRLRTSSRGGAITQSHIDASAANLQTLRLYQPRVQVHLRDPRQAMLSMTHHLRRFWDLYHDRGVLLTVEPCPPAEFFESALEKQIDWMIDNYLPGCVRWIGEWLDVIDRKEAGHNVLLTTFEELIRDESAFLERMLSFFEVPSERFSKPVLDKTMAVHFRQGTPDEWRSVFTPAQQDRAGALMPVEWRDRFGWPV